MAIAKKGLRKITVEQIVYGWKAGPPDDWSFGVTIVPFETRSPVLTAQFQHHKYFGYPPQPPHPQVSPKIIETLIRRALAMGWPSSGNLHLGASDELLSEDPL